MFFIIKTQVGNDQTFYCGNATNKGNPLFTKHSRQAIHFLTKERATEISKKLPFKTQVEQLNKLI